MVKMIKKIFCLFSVFSIILLKIYATENNAFEIKKIEGKINFIDSNYISIVATSNSQIYKFNIGQPTKFIDYPNGNYSADKSVLMINSDVVIDYHIKTEFAFQIIKLNEDTNNDKILIKSELKAENKKAKNQITNKEEHITESEIFKKTDNENIDITSEKNIQLSYIGFVYSIKNNEIVIIDTARQKRIFKIIQRTRFFDANNNNKKEDSSIAQKNTRIRVDVFTDNPDTAKQIVKLISDYNPVSKSQNIAE